MVAQWPLDIYRQVRGRNVLALGIQASAGLAEAWTTNLKSINPYILLSYRR